MKLPNILQISIKLFESYFGRKNPIACGPECAAMGFDIAGWNMNIFTPGEQPGDSILMIFHNPHNLKLFEQKRKLDYSKFPPNEVPQCYEILGNILYKESVCKFSFGLSFEEIKDNIMQENPVMICGNFPAGGHYVLAVGFDDSNLKIIYNDPYPPQWKDGVGYNREMDMLFLQKKIKKWKIVFLKKY